MKILIFNGPPEIFQLIFRGPIEKQMKICFSSGPLKIKNFIFRGRCNICNIIYTKHIIYIKVASMNEYFLFLWKSALDDEKSSIKVASQVDLGNETFDFQLAH